MVEKSKIITHPQFGSVEITIGANEETLYKPKDIAIALGYKDCASKIKNCCKSRIYVTIMTKGGPQRTKFIPESEVLKMVGDCNSPSAKKFIGWLREEGAVFKKAIEVSCIDEGQNAPQAKSVSTGQTKQTNDMQQIIKTLETLDICDTKFAIYGTPEEPLFLAKDVATVIEHTNSRMMLQSIDDEEKIVKNVYTAGGSQKAWLLTEDGLYEILMRSSKPIAKTFKKYIKAELKRIRAKVRGQSKDSSQVAIEEGEPTSQTSTKGCNKWPKMNPLEFVSYIASRNLGSCNQPKKETEPEKSEDSNLYMQVFNFENIPISFRFGEGVMINATEMAKAFGKKPAEWLRLPSTQEFLDILVKVRKSHIEKLIKTVRGGTTQTGKGTWMHEDVALEFARWLSLQFAIWCNDRIKEMLLDSAQVQNNAEQLEDLHTMQSQINNLEQRITVIESQTNTLEPANPAPEGKKFEFKAYQPDPKETLYSIKSLVRILASKGFVVDELAMFKFLRNKGVLGSKGKAYNLPTPMYVQHGLMKGVVYSYTSKSGRSGNKMSTRITAEGMDYFLKKFLTQPDLVNEIQ